MPPDAEAAAAGEAAAPPAVATPEPRTYCELYSTAANNPGLERTAGFLASYRFTEEEAGEGVPTPAMLRDQTLKNKSKPNYKG